MWTRSAHSTVRSNDYVFSDANCSQNGNNNDMDMPDAAHAEQLRFRHSMLSDMSQINMFMSDSEILQVTLSSML